MGVHIKTSRRITPKDKSKIKRTVTTNIDVVMDGDKVVSYKKSRSVKRNKSNK